MTFQRFTCPLPREGFVIKYYLSSTSFAVNFYDYNVFQGGFHGHGGLMGEPDSWSPELEQKIKLRNLTWFQKGHLLTSLTQNQCNISGIYLQNLGLKCLRYFRELKYIVYIRKKLLYKTPYILHLKKNTIWGFLFWISQPMLFTLFSPTH